VSITNDDCGCYACRCGHPHLCRYEPIPVVYTDLEVQSTLGIIARHEARFYYEKKGEEA